MFKDYLVAEDVQLSSKECGLSNIDAASEQNYTDAELLTFIMCGENWALSEIHDRYARLVFSIAFRTLNDQASAEEIVEQVFTKVWQHVREYRVERGKFSNWVSTITYHQCIDELRHRRLPIITDSNDWESLDQPANENGSVEDIFDQTLV